MHKSHGNAGPIPPPNGFRDSLSVNNHYGHRGRSSTPICRAIPANAAHLMHTIEADLSTEEDPRLAIFRDLYVKSEARLNALLGGEEQGKGRSEGADESNNEQNEEAAEKAPATARQAFVKTTRHINEDDYDESDEEEDDGSAIVSPLKSKSMIPTTTLATSATAMLRGSSSSSTPVKAMLSSVAGKTTEEARKKLEEDTKATEEAAKRSFHTFFYTLENDKDAMMEQKKLEESEHQVDVEMGATGVSSSLHGGSAGTTQQGTLSQTNLGASSLALKNLIRVIDSSRHRVPASDPELRTLFNDVRKGRGKWASEEKVGQEELYEAAETVLNQLRGSTEHSGPFLTRVNKKEAPDYSNGKFTHLGGISF